MRGRASVQPHPVIIPIITLNATPMLAKVPASGMFVSEPPPHLFGNPANEKAHRAWTNANWLKSRFHFSFAEYRDARNQNFGALRVLNDDLVQPARGFGQHPHRDMEIATIVLGPGSLTHKDSMGTEETLHRGAVQFMTAGTGVYHEEHNRDPENPLRFLQTWIVPRKRGLSPNYGSYTPASASEYANGWSHLVSDVGGAGKVNINQDFNIYMAEVDAGVSLPPLALPAGRQAYVVCAEGAAQVSLSSGGPPVELGAQDAAKCTGGPQQALHVTSTAPARSLVVAMEMQAAA